MPSTRLTIVTPAASRDAENQWIVDNIDPQGADTFSNPLTGDGTFVTHYWCSGQWGESEAALLVEHYGDDAHAEAPDRVLEALSLSRYAPDWK